MQDLVQTRMVLDIIFILVISIGVIYLISIHRCLQRMSNDAHQIKMAAKNLVELKVNWGSVMRRFGIAEAQKIGKDAIEQKAQSGAQSE